MAAPHAGGSQFTATADSVATSCDPPVGGARRPAEPPAESPSQPAEFCYTIPIQQITMYAAEEQIEEERHDRWVLPDDVHVPHKDPGQRLAGACPYAKMMTGLCDMGSGRR